MAFLAVYGHAIMDTIIESPKAPENEEFTGIDGYYIRYGGTGANIAMAVARLGVPVALHAFVGTDFPEDYRKRLENEGVDISGLVVKEGMSPRVWIVNTPEGQRGFVFQGVMGKMDEYERVYPADGTEWVHISTGRPEYNIDIAKYARKKGMYVSFDPGQELHYVYDREHLQEMLELTHIFFCNEAEMEKVKEIMGYRCEDQILDTGIFAAIKTMGEKGSFIIQEGGNSEGKPVVVKQKIDALRPEKVVDTTGAGDAYRGGFYAGRYDGKDVFDSAILGSAVASIAVEGHGAQEPLPTPEMLVERLKRNYMLL